MRLRGTQRDVLIPVRTADPATNRAQERSHEAIRQLQSNYFAQAVPVEVTLLAGLNKIGHGTGRRIRHVLVSATDDAAAVVTSRQADNPRPHLQAWVELTGATSAKVLLVLLPAVS